MSTSLLFDHVNLNDVDPSAKPVPVGDYTFEVVGAGIKEYKVKTGDNAGQTAQRIAFDVVIVNSDTMSGRRLFPSMFPDSNSENQQDSFAAKQMRILANATGISQDGTLEQWLTDLVENKARFAAPVVDKLDKTKTPTGDTQINFWKTAPAA